MNDRSTNEAPPERYAQYEPIGMARWLIAAAIVAVVIVVLAIVLLPDIGSRPATKRAISINNMKQIAIAMQNYHDLYLTLPPAYVADAQGKPSVSWRTLLLSLLEETQAYNHYDQSVPWNSPLNRPTAEQQLYIFRSPRDANSHTASKLGITNYVVVTGEETVFPNSRPINLSDIRDGTTRTILIVEILDSDIAWTEPRDLTMDEFLERVRQGKNFKGPNRLGDPCIIAFVDGSVHALDLDKRDETTARALLTRAGGEEVHPDQWEYNK